MNKLNRDSDPVTGAVHRTGQHTVHIQLATDLGKARAVNPIRHHRRSRHHSQVIDLRKTGDKRFGYSIRKVILRRVARKILERQNGQ